MRRASKLAIILAVSAVILVLVIYWVGFEATANAMLDAGVWSFLSIGGVMAVLLVLQAGAWAALNGGIRHRVRFRTLLSASMVGMAGNILTPSTYLGGEPAKVIYAGRRTGLPYQELAGIVLLGKYLEAISFVLFVGAGTLVAAKGFHHVLFEPPNTALGITVTVVAVLALGFGGLLWMSLSRKWTPLTSMVELAARLRLGRRFFARLRNRTFYAERLASRVFREEGSAVIPSFLAYLLAHAAMFIKPLAFFYLGFKTPLGLAELALIFLTCQILLAFQLTPSGIGTLEAGLFGMLALADIAITGPQCTAFLVCLRFWDAAVVATGAILATRVGVGLLAPAPAPPQQPGQGAAAPAAAGACPEQTDAR